MVKEEGMGAGREARQRGQRPRRSAGCGCRRAVRQQRGVVRAAQRGQACALKWSGDGAAQRGSSGAAAGQRAQAVQRRNSKHGSARRSSAESEGREREERRGVPAVPRGGAPPRLHQPPHVRLSAEEEAAGVGQGAAGVGEEDIRGDERRVSCSGVGEELRR
ncbi:hypothetical protein PVAP13_4KG196681 [Panicum virgatum]|uniref:Uncharacterized protein n=1 Tax=Panicum virgatum TaxID=38727 RepID=A0A8T0TN58_PANVG|nr:hypothetical protein PVAP13_4KG196681 [Panicum virgatum]